MKRSRILSLVLCISMVLSLFTFNAVNVSAEEGTWEELYSYTGSAGVTDDGKTRFLFNNNNGIKLRKGYKYHIVLETKVYISGIGGGDFKIADADSSVRLFYRPDGGKKVISDSSETQLTYSANSGQNAVKFDMLFDMTTATPTASVDVYDVGKTTKLGTINANLTGIDSIQKIYYIPWADREDGYQSMYQSTLKVYKFTDKISDWSTVYSNSWANGGLGYHPNGQVVTYYDGSLSGANEEIYRVTFKGKIYRNVDGFNFRLKDSDTTQVLFSRNESSYNFDGSHSYTTANNPDNLEIVMLVDFSKATPTADIDFYINGASTPFYTKSATLNDIDSIKKIDVYVWSSGNLDYSAPAKPSLKIERKVIGHWEEKYATTGNPDLNGQFYYYLQNGGFSGSNSEKYRITFTAGHYTNISGGELFVGDSDSTSRVFFKSDYSNRFENDDNLNFPNDSNPCYVTVQAVVDFSTNPPTADVYFYEKDNDTPFGSKTVTLTDIDSIQSISWKVWDVNNIFYTTPKNPVLTVEKFIMQDIELNDADLDVDAIDVDVVIDNSFGGGSVSLPYVLIAGYYNGNELIYSDFAQGTVAVGQRLDGHTFTIPSAVRGNFTKATVFLWKDLVNIEPYVLNIDAE